MRSVTILAVLAPLLLAACSADADDPLAGEWTLRRTLTSATPGCDEVTSHPLDVTLAPGAEDEIVLDELTSSGANAGGIDGTHVAFGSADLPFESGSDTLIIGWDLDLVDDQLVGTASAQGDGPRIDCRWTWDVVGTRL